MSESEPIRVTPIPGGFRLALTGPFDMNTARLEAELDRVVGQKPKVVEFDLTATEYLSTVGLSTLISLHNRLQSGGGMLKIVAIRKRTLGVLQTAKLDQVLHIAPEAER